MGLPLTCLLVMQKICISRTGLVYVPVIALSDRNLARPYTLYQSRELRCVIFSRQYFWFKRKSVTFLKRSCRHVFFALAPRSRASRATFTRSQSYSTSLFFHANSHDLRRLIYVDIIFPNPKINNTYITYIQKKNTKCLFYLTCTETCTTTECDIKKNVENAGHGLWLYDIKGIYIFDASEASIAIYKGN